MRSPAATREAPARRGRVPSGAVALALAGTALVLAALAVAAARVGPLVAHPPAAAAEPPRAITGADVPAVSFPVPPARPGGEWSAAWLWWIGIAVLVLLAAAALWWLVLALRRRLPRAVAASAPAVAVPSLDAMLGGLSEPAEADLGDERTFRAARAADDIIGSWETVERAAAAAGLPRRAASTPTEFLEDLTAATEVGGAAADRAARPSSGDLLALYHRARFDVVALTPGAATRARAAASDIVARLALRGHDAVPATSPTSAPWP